MITFIFPCNFPLRTYHYYTYTVSIKIQSKFNLYFLHEFEKKLTYHIQYTQVHQHTQTLTHVRKIIKFTKNLFVFFFDGSFPLYKLLSFCKLLFHHSQTFISSREEEDDEKNTKGTHTQKRPRDCDIEI